ncbi:MAG: LacI family transcriptional regulator [Clostridiales bacterium]|nr:LacI family transcriptional regulator [Clostridiales bacterium]
MKKTVSIMDIANALGLSRNTVSKALNGQHVNKKTEQLIINTAINMGYKNYNVISTKKTTEQQKILVLSSVSLLASNYYIYLLKGITNKAEEYGFEVLQYFFRPNSSLEVLNTYINNLKVNGLICLEFFNEKMVNKISSLNLPIVFLDYPTYNYNLNGNFDILLSENLISVTEVCNQMIEKGLKKFCFVGNPQNCKSFYERFLGMREALHYYKIPFEEKNNITDTDISVYDDENVLAKHIASLPVFPECFVCANDYLALQVLSALKILKKTCSKTLNVLGYDNTPESKSCTPKLSTINVNKVDLGTNAVHILAERMTKKTPCKIIYLQTSFVLRESTKILSE